jgi:hypothetical protein
MKLEFDSYITPSQQVHNNPSCEGLLCTCCVDVVNLTFFSIKLICFLKNLIMDLQKLSLKDIPYIDLLC